LSFCLYNFTFHSELLVKTCTKRAQFALLFLHVTQRDSFKNYVRHVCIANLFSNVFALAFSFVRPRTLGMSNTSKLFPISIHLNVLTYLILSNCWQLNVNMKFYILINCTMTVSFPLCLALEDWMLGTSDEMYGKLKLNSLFMYLE